MLIGFSGFGVSGLGVGIFDGFCGSGLGDSLGLGITGSFGFGGLYSGVLGDGLDPALLPPEHLSLLQSTGRLTTGKHCLTDFWFGLFFKQLLLSSNCFPLLFPGTQLSASPLK